jgi:Domain of unknown function (DUF4404)
MTTPPPKVPSKPSSPPTRAQLQQSLEQLHAQLASSSQVDARSRALLHAVLDDVRRLLAASERRSAEHEPATPGPAAQGPDSAPRRLADLAVEFEARHPVLAGSLMQFVDLLGSAGL